MTIQFCVIKDRVSGRYISCKQECWGHGSTMTGPMYETVFELSPLSSMIGTYGEDKFAMFETAKCAQDWIDSSYGGKRFVEEHTKRRKDTVISLEVVTFADIDSIVEQQLLGDDQ